MLKAVCWDMDGLIFNTEEVYRKSWQAAAACQQFTIPDDVYRDFIGRQDWECEERLVSYTQGNIDIEQFRRDRSRDFEQRLARECDYKEGFAELISAVAESGLKQALVTSSTLPEVKRNFAGSDYLDYYSVIVTAESVSSGKPCPDCYLLACRQLGIEPSEAIVLEDSFNGVQAAFQAGCRPVMVPDMVPPSPDLPDSVQIVSSLLDVVPVVRQCSV